MEIKINELTSAHIDEDGNLYITQYDNQEIIFIQDDVNKLRDFLNDNIK